MKKKITALIFLFTLLATLQVHAAYQLKGTFNGWKDITLVQNPSNSNEYYNENPVYVNGSDNSRTWTELCIHNGNTYYQSNGSNLEAQKDYNFGNSGNNIKTSLADKQAYTFYLDIQKNKVYVKKAYDIVYLRGSMSSGTENQDAYKFSTTDGNEYTLEVASLDANTEFKVFNEVRNELSGYNELTVTGCEYTNSDGNIKLSTALTNVKLTYNKSAKTLTISGDSSSSDSYCLKTSENGWGTTIPLDDNGDGTYSCTMTNPAEGLQFMVQMNGTDHFWPTSAVTYSGGEQTINLGTTSGNNITMGRGLSGEYTITLNPDAKTLTISGGSTPTPSVSYRLKYTEDNWSNSKYSDPLTDNGNGTYGYTITNPVEGLQFMVQRSTDSGKSYLDFCWPAAEDKNYTGGDKTFTMSGGFGNNVTFGAGLKGDYTLTFTPNTTDPKQSTLKIKGTAVATFDAVYLTGSFNGWKTDTDNDNYKFKTTDGKVYTLTGVNIDNGKLLKVYYDGNYYGHDANKVTGPVSAENDGKGGFNMKLTEELKDATITFDITDAVKWKLTIVNGGAVEHKPYYFVGDMNRWYSKEFEGDESAKGIDPNIFAAEKDKWKFEYVGEVAGQTEKGWYKYVFDKDKVGMSTLVGQFQIIDRGDWNNGAEVYSHNPKVTDYNDASGFARYINNPITSEMIINEKPLTKDGTPGIVKANGSNFHLDCNGVNDAVIYFLPGDNPKMIVKGKPTNYFVFYSANKKTDGDNTVSMQIVNDKPNVNNYYLPGVKNLKNYTKADASAEGPHMNIAPVELTMIDFSEPNFEQTNAFKSVFGASENVGDMSLVDFVTMIKTDKKLPNGISLDGREQVYVIKIPNGFEYAAGTKFAVKFDKAFAASEIGSASTIVANHLYFFNDELHVMLNVDNYEDGAEAENAYVKLYYRVYGYDGAYNTVVVNSDGKTTTKLYNKGAVIGNTEDDIDQKDAGWVEYNHYGVMPESFTGAPAGNWHYATPSAESTAIYGLDPKFGNFFVQFKIVTGPKKSQATNGPAKVVDKVYTLYLPEKTLALNQEGFYNFNGQDIYQKFDGGYTTTDVEDVFEDQIVEEGVDAEPIFFNLQGQRVVNPEKGMYIVVKGNKTYKVMIK